MFLIYSHNCLCSMLLYFTRFHLQSSIFTLIHFTFLCVISLGFTLCFAFPIPLLFNPPSLLCSYPGSFHVFAFIRFILPYFTLFSLHLYSVCFALLRFFTLPRFGLLRFVSRFAFLIFLGPVFALVLTSPLLGTSHVLLFLAQLASLSLAPFCFPLFRFARLA